MKKTLAVLSHEISTTLRRKSFLIIGIGLPLLLGIVALVVIVLNPDGSQAPAPETGGAGAAEGVVEGYVDEGGLIQALPDDVPSGWLVAYPDEAAAQAALQADEITGYYVIPADYVTNGEVTHVRQEYNPVTDDVNVRGIDWVLAYNLLGDAQLAAEVWNPLNVKVTALQPADAESGEESWIVEMLPTLMALILYMVILMPASMLVNAITDEKKNLVMEVLMSSMSAQQLLTGKILALGILGLLQTAMWMGVLWVVARFGGQALNIPAGFEVPTALLVWSFIYGFLGYAMYGAQMAGLGALVPDLKDARGATFVVLSPLIVVYMFNMIVINAPNGPFALFVSLFPLTAPVGMIARMTQTTVPVWQAALSAVLQLLTAILIVRLVGRMFHARNLLSGQPFSLQQYFRTFLRGTA
jgi:ABC-2 type transport system permease protein